MQFQCECDFIPGCMFLHICRYDKISRATSREESDTDLDDGASSMVPGKKSTLA